MHTSSHMRMRAVAPQVQAVQAMTLTFLDQCCKSPAVCSLWQVHMNAGAQNASNALAKLEVMHVWSMISRHQYLL